MDCTSWQNTFKEEIIKKGRHKLILQTKQLFIKL